MAERIAAVEELRRPVIEALPLPSKDFEEFIESPRSSLARATERSIRGDALSGARCVASNRIGRRQFGSLTNHPTIDTLRSFGSRPR